MQVRSVIQLTFVLQIIKAVSKRKACLKKKALTNLIYNFKKNIVYPFRTSKAYNPFSSPPQYTSSHYRVNCISKPESDNTLNFNRVLIDSLYICMCAKIRCHTYHHNTPSKICLQHLSQTGHYMY